MPVRAHRERERRLRVPARARASVGHAGVHAEVVLRGEVVRRVGVVAARGLLRERTLDLCPGLSVYLTPLVWWKETYILRVEQFLWGAW